MNRRFFGNNREIGKVRKIENSGDAVRVSIFNQMIKSLRQGDFSAHASEEPVPTENKNSGKPPLNIRDSLAEVLPLIYRIVKAKMSVSQEADVSDVVQKTALRLWRWQTRHPEKITDLTEAEWRSYAARTAFNEVNRGLANSSPVFEVLSEHSETFSEGRILGNSPTEFASLVSFGWREIEKLSVRRRRALLLQSFELITFLRQGGISATKIRFALELSAEDWERFKDELPLSDAAIAGLAEHEERESRRETSAASVKKARHEARTKLQHLKI